MANINPAIAANAPVTFKFAAPAVVGSDSLLEVAVVFELVVELLGKTPAAVVVGAAVAVVKVEIAVVVTAAGMEVEPATEIEGVPEYEEKMYDGVDVALAVADATIEDGVDITVVVAELAMWKA